MQYSKRQTNSNRLRCGGKNIGPLMLRLMLKAVALLALAAPALGLAGCSDSLSANDTSFAKVNESYKDTLDADKKKAVITEMKQERAEVQKAAGIEPEPAAPAKSDRKKKKQAEAKAKQAAAKQSEPAQTEVKQTEPAPTEAAQN